MGEIDFALELREGREHALRVVSTEAPSPVDAFGPTPRAGEPILAHGLAPGALNIEKRPSLFDTAAVQSAIGEAWRLVPGHTYTGFCEKAVEAGRVG